MKSQLKHLSLIHVEFHVLIGLPDYFKHKLHDFTGFNLFVSIRSNWVFTIVYKTTEWPCKQNFVLCLSTFRHTGTFHPQNSFPWSKNFLDLPALKYSATLFIFNESWLWAKFWKDAKLHIPRVKSALLWLKTRVVICHIGNNRICNSIHYVSIVPKCWMLCS